MLPFTASPYSEAVVYPLAMVAPCMMEQLVRKCICLVEEIRTFIPPEGYSRQLFADVWEFDTSSVPAVPNGIVHYARLEEARLIYLTRPIETAFLADSLSANGMLLLRKLGMPVGPMGEDVYECEVPVFEEDNGCPNSISRFRQFLTCIGTSLVEDPDFENE
jgi:hypothetical protein